MEYNAAMPKALGEFLESKGGVGVLVVLQNRGRTYSEIESNVLITSSTISQRLDDASDLGLVETIRAKRHGRSLHEYHLTDFGEEVVEDLARRGIVSNYRDMRTHHQAMKEKLDEFNSWLQDNPGQYLGFTEVHEETLIDRDSKESEGDSNGDEVDADSDDESENDRPQPPTAGLSDDSGGNAGNPDVETASETSTDDDSDEEAQTRLSNPDDFEKMREYARDPDSDDEE